MKVLSFLTDAEMEFEYLQTVVFNEFPVFVSVDIGIAESEEDLIGVIEKANLAVTFVLVDNDRMLVGADDEITPAQRSLDKLMRSARSAEVYVGNVEEAYTELSDGIVYYVEIEVGRDNEYTVEIREDGKIETPSELLAKLLKLE